MKRIFVITACVALPGATFAATRTYDTGAFDRVSVAAGVTADITVGPVRSVSADTRSDDFDDLRITVKDNVLHIDRPTSNWFSLGHHPDYQVHVVTPALHSMDVSSGSDVKAEGVTGGDFSVTASSGSNVSVAGSCISLKAVASSGSDLDADDLKCETVSVHASSGSDVSVAASKSVTGDASSGSDVRVRGRPSTVQVDKSSGAHLAVKE